MPINNAPDLPGETPGTGPGQTDMSGFTVVVEDGGGRYGASAGVQSLDAFGNPLGTTYDALGNVTGFAPLVVGPDGRLTIKNLAPGKYGISAVPPAGQGWQQTSTIEGTKIIDAWVEAGEPPFFAEFGPPGFHAFIGFVQDFNDLPMSGGTTISGTVVNQHLSRPPDYAFFNGACFGHTTPWVGLNDMSVGIGEGIYAAATDEDCNFSIPNVPDGNYQLVVWDNNLDVLFTFKGITIAAGECIGSATCDLGPVPVFQWFHRQEHFVYNDINGNGIYEDGLGETPILEQAVINRWRDGTVYQENVSDPAGLYAFDQVFPFFSWLVTEVDFARFEATSLTVVVDNGGPIPGLGIGGVPGPSPEDDLTFGGAINPQDQTSPADPDCDGIVCLETDNLGAEGAYRIDFGPVLTAGVQGFLGQTNAFQWGKRHYADGVNGGISGIVFYAITRAENDPEVAAAEPWEPGVPGVVVNLYESLGVDAYGVAIKGALLNTTTTDSWDDSIPTGCKYGNGATAPFEWSPDGTNFYSTDCYDGLRVFNQVRPGVFDGGYAFDATCADDGGMAVDGSCTSFTSPMPVGNYIVEMIAPDGYEDLKPEDKNVDFGDVYEPAPELLPPPCAGKLAEVPAILTLFPDEGIPAPFAGTERPLCDTKLVTLSAGANAAADFWVFTEVPVAAHAIGFILDDTQNEFDPNSPNFGEKYAPPFVPVTIRDWTGRIIGQTLSDQYGRYNFLAPSTITTNLPAPSGMSPNMLTTCMNDPGDDPINPDPNHNQLYSTFCYTFQYMPGTTTYLDTPVVPVAAFTGPDQFPLDCEFPDGTPRIWEVRGDGFGPYIAASTGTEILTITSMGSQLVQNPEYCNPAAGECAPGSDTVNKTIIRDYGLGLSPTVKLVAADESEHLLTGVTGDNITITGTVPALPDGPYQLVVTRGNGHESLTAVTVQIGLRQGADVIRVTPDLTDPPNLLATPIQSAIGFGTEDPDTIAKSNDLILLDCGTYNEMVVMWKPVQLQGSGECTTINAVKAPFEKLETWRGTVDGLVNGGKIDLLPGQEAGGGPPEPLTLQTEEGAGVLVVARAGGGNAFDSNKNRGARVDGINIRGADTGGGIIVNGYGDYLQISNNRVSSNQGFSGGGIRVGHPNLTNETECDDADLCYTDADNDWVDVHHNQVVFNGALSGAGGGISMCTGSDSYRITENWVCGNFSLRDGAGIGHIGVSDGAWELQGGGKNKEWVQVEPSPLIADNTIVFNESFFQGATVSGGGIFAGGTQPLTPGGLTAGAGNLQINGNVLKGNSAGAGDGGGIRLAGINGQDVEANPDNEVPGKKNDPAPWYAVDVFNNMITNNVAALAGGGISLQDAVDVRVVNNTIANNDSLATAGEAFAPGSPNESTPQPGAGIVTRVHSDALANSGGDPVQLGTFSDPSAFDDNIIRQNRQFYFQVFAGTPGDPADPSVWGLCPDVRDLLLLPPGETLLPCVDNSVVYDDLAVIGVAGTLECDTPGSCILTDPLVDPLFVAEYFNGDKSSVLQQEAPTAIGVPPAFDEGGNFIRPQFGPLSLFADDAPDDGDPGTPFGDYHLQAGSPAVDNVGAVDLTGTYPELLKDFDLEPRPSGAGVDVGADEVQQTKAAAIDERSPTTRRGATGRAGTGN